MSRIGKQQLSIPAGVTVIITGQHCAVTGPSGELAIELQPFITATVADDTITVAIENPADQHQRAMWGTTTALIKNLIIGVSTGYKKSLVIKGVGYNWKVAGNTVTVSAGYSHQIPVELPAGVTASSEGDTLTLSGMSKQLVGQVAANIRSLRTPEPYKGSGIRYSDEVIKRKAGKQAAGA